MVALVSYVLYSTLKPELPAMYEMSEVSYGTITEYLDVNGTVESGVTESFTAIEGVVVEEVLVTVGDKVEKGDLLATFNTSGVSGYLNDAEKEYDEALKAYNDAKKSADNNSKREAQIKSEIASLEKEIKALEKEIEELEAAVGEPTTEMVTLPQEQIDAIVLQMTQNGATEDEINAFLASASQTQIPVVNGNNEAQNQLMEKNLELAQLNSEVSSLQAENAVLAANDNEALLESLKAVADSKKSAYDKIKEIYNAMKDGWYAENDGIVTVVNVKAGEKFVPVNNGGSAIDLSALLGADVDTSNAVSAFVSGGVTAPTGVGITLESYGDMIVSVTVGKADLLKIKVGMEAVVTSLDSEYEAEVIYVGATAIDSSNSFDISSIMSGTGGANGALVKIKINNPDEKVVIGFDVDIKIKLNTVENVLRVPVESVVYNNGKYFVFVYDENEGTTSRREIVKGSLDDVSYEVTGGLVEGEKVLKSPDPNMVDGTRVAEKTAK